MDKKGILLFVGIFVLIMIVILVIALYNNRKVVIEDIVDFHYSSSLGMAIYNRVSYDIHCDNVCVAKILPNQVADEDVVTVSVSPQKLKELEEVLNRYQVGKWDGFDKNDKNVLDGDSFSLSVKTKSGMSVSAHGYMKWPKNYSEVAGEIETFFQSLLKENA